MCRMRSKHELAAATLTAVKMATCSCNLAKATLALHVVRIPVHYTLMLIGLCSQSGQYVRGSMSDRNLGEVQAPCVRQKALLHRSSTIRHASWPVASAGPCHQARSAAAVELQGTALAATRGIVPNKSLQTEDRASSSSRLAKDLAAGIGYAQASHSNLILVAPRHW